jgi:hypothetical protein
MMGYGERLQCALLRASGRVPDEDLRARPPLNLPSKADRRPAWAAPLACPERACSDSYFSIMTSRPGTSCNA